MSKFHGAAPNNIPALLSSDAGRCAVALGGASRVEGARRRLALRAALNCALPASVLAVSSLFGADAAMAACTGTNGSYICSGTSTTRQTLTAPSLDMLATSDYIATTPFAYMLQLRTQAGGGPLSFVQQAGSSITAMAFGVDVENAGLGATDVRLAGNIHATVGVGISVLNSSTATDATFIQTGGSLTGDVYGAQLHNVGTGVSDITLAGTIAGQSADGFGVYNGGASTGLTLNQAGGSASGGVNGSGIFVSNDATGSTRVTTAGTVSSTGRSGVYIWNGYAADEVTFEQTAGSITGLLNGVDVGNEGSGAATVTTASDITATYGAAVFIENGATGTDILYSQLSGSLRGGGIGVDVYNGGTGETRITIGAAVRGDYGAAITATNDAMATNLTIEQAAGSTMSGPEGILATNRGTGTTDITLAGTVEGQWGSALSVNTSGSAAAVTVDQSGGSLTGDRYGIFIENGGIESATITTAGDVTATSGTGVYGTNLMTGTDLTFTQLSGSISGSILGVELYNGGTGDTRLTTSDTVRGDAWWGVVVVNGTTASGLTIEQLSGGITGATDGLFAFNAGTGETDIRTNGVVIGEGGAGLTAQTNDTGADLKLTQTGGSISGTSYGAVLLNAGVGATRVVQSAADAGIVGQAGDGLYVGNGTVDTPAATSIEIDMSGTVTGAQNGIQLTTTARAAAPPRSAVW